MVKVSWFTKGWLVYIYLILNILNSYTRSTISKRVDTLNVIFLLYYSSAQVVRTILRVSGIGEVCHITIVTRALVSKSMTIHSKT